MQQPDNCGCSNRLVTPTVEELLAVARRKPLPTIRERRPPSARVAASMKGWVRWGLIDRSGREVRGGEGPNLITDQGLDQIATTAIYDQLGGASGGSVTSLFTIITYAAVGTDNTTPDVSDTGLGMEVSRTATEFASDTIARASDGVYALTRSIEFDYGKANGNLTEWGFSSNGSAGSNLFNRALFLDGGGSPEVVTKTTDYKLRIIYTLEVTLSPVTFTAGAFTVTGVGTVNGDYTLLGGAAPSGSANPGSNRCAAPDLKLFSYWARGGVGVINTGLLSMPPDIGCPWVHASDLSGAVYGDTVSYTGDSANGRGPRATSAARDAYSPGSFQRTGGGWKWDTAYGNLDPIKGFYVQGAFESYNSGLNSCGRAGYAFDLDLADEFSKDNEHTLTIGVPTVSWGRGS